MKNRIEKIYKIHKEDLNQGDFFDDLLTKLVDYKFASMDDIYFVQGEVVKLLTEKVYRFTKGESSSVREETAQSLLTSIYYTISEYFKNINNLDDGMIIIKEKGLESLYKKGKRYIDIKFEKSKRLFKALQDTKIDTTNYAYNDTIGDDGISGFFDEYDKEFGCHESPGSIDYPLNIIVDENLSGIDYLYKYVKNLLLENKFLNKFDYNCISELLNGYDENSDSLLINIFEVVLNNVLGNAILGKDVLDLNIKEMHRKFLKDFINKLSLDEFTDGLLNKKSIIFDQLNIEDDEVKEYVTYSIEKAANDIYTHANEDELDKIFITLKPIDTDKITYIDSKKTSNSKFRKISEKIRSCKDYKDKINIINNNITSLEDLVDILECECLFDMEYINLYDTLDDSKLALLLKYMPDITVQTDDFDEVWMNMLKLYLDNLYGNRKEKILFMSKKIIL